MVPGSSVKSSKEALRLSRLYPNVIFSTAGMISALPAINARSIVFSLCSSQAFIRTIPNRLLKNQTVGMNLKRLPVNRNAQPLDHAAWIISVIFPNPIYRNPYSKSNCCWQRSYVNLYSFMNDRRKWTFWIYLGSMWNAR